MSAADEPPSRPGSHGDGMDEGVADVLGDVRDLLGVLDGSVAAPGLASTTIDMAAVSRSSAPGRPAPLLPRGRPWGIATACVLAALAAGYAVGRALTPDPDGPILQYLPVVEHIDVLQEAGSVAFLEEISRRHFPQPRAFPRPGDPAAATGEEGADAWEPLEASLESLRAGPFGPETPPAVIADRRDHIEDMDAQELRSIADRVTVFRSLSRADRHDLIELARAFGESDDEQVEMLAAAARLWHAWVAWSDPADRQAVVALDREGRVEWLERRMRGPGRSPRTPGWGFGGGRGNAPSGQPPPPERRSGPSSEGADDRSGTGDASAPARTEADASVTDGRVSAPETSPAAR